MKFGKYLLENSVIEWRNRYIDYSKLKKALKLCVLASEDNGDIMDFEQPEELWCYTMPLTCEDYHFFEIFQNYVERASEFFYDRVKECLIRVDALEEQCIALDGFEGLQSEPTDYSELVVKGDPKKRLEKAILEFYRLCEMLENFRILNQIACKKIMKKYRKSRSKDVTVVNDKANHLLSQNEEIPRSILSKLENLYTTHFEQNRKSALQKLKMETHHDTPYSYWRAGFLTGISLPLLVQILYELNTTSQSAEKLFLVTLYGAFSIPILAIYFFSYCLVLLKKYRINWILIFELDPRRNI